MRARRFLCFLLLLTATGCATVKTYDEYSPLEISALEESQTRINSYRQKLKESNDTGGLNALIDKELAFQDAIIRKEPQVRTLAKELLYRTGEAVKATPLLIAGAGMVVLQGMAESGVTISP